MTKNTTNPVVSLARHMSAEIKPNKISMYQLGYVSAVRQGVEALLGCFPQFNRKLPEFEITDQI